MIAVCLGSAACHRGPELRTKSLLLSAADTANANSPVIVDVVAVYDESTLEKFAAFTARDWFAQRDDLWLVNGGEWDYCTLEPPPGTELYVDPLPLERGGGVGLLLYALYIEGGYRARLDRLEKAAVRLGAAGISVEELDGPAPRASRSCEARNDV